MRTEPYCSHAAARGAVGLVLLVGLALATAAAQEPPRTARLVDASGEAARARRGAPAPSGPSSAETSPLRAAPTAASQNVLFSVNFDSDCSQVPPAPPPSPPPPYPPPLGFTVHNVDNRTPDPQVGYVTHAWIVREDFSFNVADCVMFSTSWYTPTGAADDWAVFPTAAAGPLSITATTELRWNAVTYDPAYRDGYEVRYSTAGTAPADFLANPPLFTVAAENTAWTARSLSLASLAGQSVHLAFRNNSNDKFLLLIDDIVVENLQPYDPALESLTQSPHGGYARVPVGLAYPFDLQAGVSNLGTAALTGVQVQADVLVDGAPLALLTSAPVGLAPGASQSVAVGSGSYAQVGSWSVEAAVSASEGDGDAANSALAVPLTEVTANELTRSEGPTTGALGIGAGNGGELGNDFVVPIAARLDAVRMSILNTDVEPDNPDPAPDGDGIGDFNGRELEVTVRSFTAGKPDALLATARLTLPSDAPLGTTDLLFAVDPPLVLLPGRYLIAGVEPTLPTPITLQLQQTQARFTPGTVWVNWPTSPQGGWANVEAFGGAFAKPFRLTAVLEAAVLAPTAFDDAFAVPEDGTLAGASVAANDIPSDQGPNTYTLIAGTDRGTLAFHPDGSFEYTPQPDFSGADDFVYRVCDATPDCDFASAEITVNPVDEQPVAADDAFSVGPQESLSASVAGNDTPSPDGGSFWTLVSAPASGSLALQPDGDFTYTPSGTFEGSVTFGYALCDIDGDCDPATVQIQVLPFRIFADGFGP